MPETNPPIATIASLADHVGQAVTLRGWLYNMRESGKLLFPIFRDGTGTIQGIVPKAAVPPEVFDRVKSLTQESSVIVTGTVRADARAPSGFELDVANVEIVHLVPEATPFPISPKEHGVDFLMEHRHLWVRTPRQAAILRIRATIMRAAQEYFDTNGFIRTDPPILTPAACEGTSTLFELDYFGDPAYLTQSGQLYIEATALALGKVYSFGPTFRAEKSKTRRHLTEFWMIEPEVAFMDLDGLMSLAEAFLTHIVTRVLECHRPDLKTIGRDVTKLEAVINPEPATESGAPSTSWLSSRSEAEGSASPTTTEPGAPPEIVILSEGAAEVEGNASPTATSHHFPRLTYDQAHQMLAEAYAAGLIETPHTYGDDFGSPDETYISSQFTKPVMIHRYPAAIKAFYMQPDPADPTRALCVDVLAPEGYGEIIGGSQRVDSYDLLAQRIADHGLPLAAFQWYLDLRRYGSVPHSGFGMGIERAVAWICALDHVRETIPFPRTLNRIYP
jgi:asparaginyl-tRNA synthetase